jgi:hypothetical protein
VAGVGNLGGERRVWDSGGWVDAFEGQHGAAASDLAHVAGQPVTGAAEPGLSLVGDQ